MRERYIKDGEGFLLIYSITEKSTLNTVKGVHNLIEKVKDSGSPIPIILVGNKVRKYTCTIIYKGTVHVMSL